MYSQSVKRVLPLKLETVENILFKFLNVNKYLYLGLLSSGGSNGGPIELKFGTQVCSKVHLTASLI